VQALKTEVIAVFGDRQQIRKPFLAFYLQRFILGSAQVDQRLFDRIICAGSGDVVVRRRGVLVAGPQVGRRGVLYG
jgi:hypothetical protein